MERVGEGQMRPREVRISLSPSLRAVPRAHASARRLIIIIAGVMFSSVGRPETEMNGERGPFARH